jgi:hypothetical protein
MTRTTASRRGRIAVAGLLLIAVGGVGASTPAVATPASDDVDLVAVVGQDNALWVNDGSGWESLGGYLIDTPAVTVGETQVYYLGLGTDRNVWIRTDDIGWTRFGPTGTRCDGPSAVVSGFGGPTPTLAVACRGGDGAVWSAHVPDQETGVPTTSSWRYVGGGVKYGVNVSDVQPWVVDDPMFAYTAVGTNDAVWINEGGTWYSEGGQCWGPASADEFLEYFGCRGLDGSLWLKQSWREGASWFAFGGKMQGKPAITVHADDSLHAYVLGGDGRVWTRSDSGSWTLYGGVGRYGVAVLTFYG